jgi:hypothetical protein
MSATRKSFRPSACNKNALPRLLLVATIVFPLSDFRSSMRRALTGPQNGERAQGKVTSRR